MKLVFATNNKHKLEEVQKAMPGGIEVLTLADVSLDVEIDETEPDLEGNALLKARVIHEHTGMSVFADDTGLEVKALNYEPGVCSARYAGEHGNSDANMDKLLAKLKGSTDRSARFRTVVALILNNEEYLFEGIVNGQIIEEKIGVKGFGYDPVFIPDGYDRTFAEMSTDEKNTISHRGRAIAAMAAFLESKI